MPSAGANFDLYSVSQAMVANRTWTLCPIADEAAGGIKPPSQEKYLMDTQGQFYAYRSYGDIRFYPVTMHTDAGTGDPVHPAGEVLHFTTEDERDAYVARRLRDDAPPQ